VLPAKVIDENRRTSRAETIVLILSSPYFLQG